MGLCIVGDASSYNNVRSLIQSYAEKDLRIKVYFREINGHIAMVDHEDVIPKYALLEFIRISNNKEKIESKLIYSDEDNITIDNKMLMLYFKHCFVDGVKYYIEMKSLDEKNVKENYYFLHQFKNLITLKLRPCAQKNDYDFLLNCLL